MMAGIGRVVNMEKVEAMLNSTLHGTVSITLAQRLGILKFDDHMSAKQNMLLVGAASVFARDTWALHLQRIAGCWRRPHGLSWTNFDNGRNGMNGSASKLQLAALERSYGG